MTNVEKFKEGWHLDKRVNLSIIIALFIQVMAGVWFINDLKNDVESNTEDIVELDQIQKQLLNATSDQRGQLVRIETELIGLRRDLGEMLEVLKEYD